MFVSLYLCDTTKLREGEDRGEVGQDYQEFIARHWSGMLGLSHLPPWEIPLGCFAFLVCIFRWYSVFSIANTVSMIITSAFFN